MTNFEASITLYPTDEGGRKSPVENGYMPTFSFEPLDSEQVATGHIVKLDFEFGTLVPGQEAKATCTPLEPAGWPKVNPGDSFLVCEGSKAVGVGNFI